MMYLLVFVILVFFAVYFYYNSERQSFFFCKVLAFGIFVYLAGMRYEIGFDFFGYSYNFVHCYTLSELMTYGWPLFRFEPGYVLFSVLVRSLTDEPQILFLSVSIICSTVLFYVLSRITEKKYFFSSILIYFSFVYLFLEMHAVRQAVAASFTYLACLLVLKEKKMFACALMCVASLFHDSAIFLLPLCFFIDKKMNVKIQIAVLIMSTFIMFLQIPWISYLSKLLNGVLPTLSGVVKFADYVNEEQRSRPIFALYFVYVFLFVFFSYKERFVAESLGRFYCVSKNMFFFFIAVTSLFWEIDYISTRMGWFLLFGLVLLLPYMVEKITHFTEFLGIAVIVVLCFWPVKHFVIPDETTMMFSPYEDYFQCRVLELECDGRKRVIEYAKNHDAYFRY